MGVGALVSIVDDDVEDLLPVDVDVVWYVVDVDESGKEEEEEYDGDDRALSGSVEYSTHPSMLSELIKVPSPISVHSPRIASVAFWSQKVLKYAVATQRYQRSKLDNAILSARYGSPEQPLASCITRRLFVIAGSPCTQWCMASP